MKFNRKYASVNTGGALAYAPVPLVIDGVNVWMNIPEKYAQAGFYPVEHTEMPVRDGYSYTSRYELQDGRAVQLWEEHEIPAEETGDESETQSEG